MPKSYVSNTITNPARQGTTFLIPKGTPLRSTRPGHQSYLAKRTYTVTLRSVGDGYVDTLGDHAQGRGFILLPYVTWAGTAGYWVDAKLTPELAEANGLTLTLPAYEAEHLDRFDKVPTFGAGSDNRDA
jgi:hypothetical protein